MLDLFEESLQPDITWIDHWLSPEAASAVFAKLMDEVAWQQDEMNTPAGKMRFPRLTSWQGDPDAVYVYSGIRNVPKPWTPTVATLKAQAEITANANFNSVLINRYRTGMDSMGWHSDKEHELGDEPTIASVSLGATRTFDFRHKKTRLTHTLRLTNGSLLVMRGRTQLDWAHRVPKEPKTQGERINLTFRWIKVEEGEKKIR